MTTRTTMADLITRLREMTNDPAGDGQKFTDEQVQRALDNNREYRPSCELAYREVVVAGGKVEIHYYFSAEGGAWEGDTILQDGNWVTITPDGKDLTAGTFTFTAHQNAPVFITGNLYDLNAAAAEMLDMRCMQLAEAYDFSADGGSYSRSQMVRNLKQMADGYRASARATTIGLVRGDETGW